MVGFKMKNPSPNTDFFFHFLIFSLPIIAVAFLGYIQIVHLSFLDEVTFSPSRQRSQLAAALPSLPSAGSWAAFPNSALRPVMAADPTPWHGSQTYIFDYSGGEFDAERNELIVWGGGHGDYSGNEVCTFALTTGTWTCTTRSVAPFAASNPGSAETQDTLSDGKPDARHTYSCLARVNIPGYDGFFCHGGSLWQGGYPVNGTWFFHRDTKTWEKLASRPLWGDSDYGATSLATFAAFDPVSKRVLVLARNRCMAFDFATKAWELKGSCDGGEYEKSAALDPERRILVVMGAGSIAPSNAVKIFDISTTPWTLIRSSVNGDQTPVLTRGVGLVFDPVGKRYIAHTGGQNLWAIDRDTWTVSILSGTGANPGPMYPASGNMGRFRYVPSTNGLVVVNSIDQNVFYYQLGGTSSPPPLSTDTTAPSVPTNLSATAVSSSQINLSWAASTDNVGIVGYRVYRSGTQIATVTSGTSYQNTGLTANTTYTYTVSAYDAAGNNSSQSSSASATTQGPTPDTQAPTVSFSAPANGTTVSGAVTVSANASDNIGVTGVQFKLDGANLGVEDTSSPYSVSWTTTNASNSSHTLTATARDQAGNQTTSISITVTVNNTVTQPPPSLSTLPVNTFYALRLPDRFHGISHTDKHVTLAYHAPTRKVYFNGGDYFFAAPDGNIGQSSYSQYTWSLDIAARFADPKNRNAGWTQEHGFCAALGEQMPKRPDYGGFASVPDQNILVYVPGEEVPSSNGNCPGETGTFANDPQYLRHHIMAFSPVTKLWRDLSANAAVDFRGSSDSDPWMSRYDETLRKIVRLEINRSNGTRIELLDMNPASPGYLTWKKTDVNTVIWAGGAGPHNVPWTFDPIRHVLYVGQRYAKQFAVVDYVNNTVTSLGSLPGDTGFQSDNTYLSFDWNARKLVYVERRNPGSNPLGGSDIAGRVWSYAVDTNGPWIEITHLPMVSLGGEPIPSTPYTTSYLPYGSDDSIPHATSLIYDPDNNVTLFFGTKSEGTLYYADQFMYVLRQNSGPTPQPPPPPPSPPSSDTQAPTISLTSPLSGASVSGTITVSVNASDNIGIAGVQFKLDGVNLGAEDTSAPYSISWNTTLASNASHTLTATARDQEGNQATSPSIAITVNNVPIALTCAPSSQSRQTNLPALFTAEGGTGVYIWSAPGGSPTSGIGASFSTTYITIGTYNVTTTSGTQNATCSVSVTKPPPSTDTDPPSAPTTLTAVVTSSSEISMSWRSSVDDVGVVGYKIYRNAIAIATSPSLHYVDSNLSPETSYTYTVTAYDLAGNTSSQSNSVTLTTLPSTEPPILPVIPLTPPPPIFQAPLYLSLRHPEVTILQRLLISRGLLLSGNDTGFYGPLTQEAVKKFQCQENIVCSGRPEDTGYGLVGTRTRERLNQISATSSTSSVQASPLLTETQRQALIQQLTEQIRQLQVQLLQLQLKLLQDQLNGRI